MKDLRSLVSKFPNYRILVVGDVMLDRFLWGDVWRINPEAPVPVLHVQRETEAPGGAANAAANVAALGGKATLAGIVGRDEAGKRLQAILSKRGIRSEFLFTEKPTSAKLRAIAQGQQLLRLDYEDKSPVEGKGEEEFIELLKGQVDGVSAVLISDYGKGVVTGNVVRFLSERVETVVVDPHPASVDRYQNVSLITPNVKEAGACVKAEIVSEGDLERVGKELVRMLNCAVLITRGERGMSLFRAARERLDLSTSAKEVTDVTGAGDTVAASVTLAITAGASLERAVGLGNRAAGKVVSKVGTATVTPAELATE